jgi:hypothetical protein
VEPFLLIAVVITSLGGYLVAVRWRGRSPATLPVALGRLLECLGAVAVFAAINLAVGAAVILGVRMFTARFVSLYLLDDVVWIIVSLVQGIAWSLWRDE